MLSLVIELAQRTGVKVLVRKAAPACIGLLYNNSNIRKTSIIFTISTEGSA